MADMMYRNPLPLHLREPAEFEIPELRRIFSQAKKILNQGCGFCVIERMPMEEIREEELIGCYWIISQLIGRTVAQKWDGTMIYDVTDTGQSSVPYTHLRAHETEADLVCRLLLEKKKTSLHRQATTALLLISPILHPTLPRHLSLRSIT